MDFFSDSGAPGEGHHPDPGILVYPAVFEDAVLFGLVSELGSQAGLRFTHSETGREIELTMPAGRAALVLVDRRNGGVPGSYQPGA